MSHAGCLNTGSHDGRVADAPEIQVVLAPVEQAQMLAEYLGCSIEELRALQTIVIQYVFPDVPAVSGDGAGKQYLRNIE